jgi:hypothetical protein
VVTGALWFGAGGGRRRPAGSMAGAFTKRKHIPRNTLRAHAGQAGRRREAAAQEGVGQCSEEGRGRPVGSGGVSLGWPTSQGPGRGKGSGPVEVEGEAAAARPNPELGQNSKRNSFRISIVFGIWQNFGKLYKEI